MSIIHNPRFQNILYRTILLTLAMLLLGAGGLPGARAQGSGQSSGITLVPGTVPVSDAVAEAAVTALEGGLSSYPNLHYFAVTDVRDMDPWMLISFVGLETYDSAAGWKLEAGGWFGLVLLKDDGRGNWAGAAQGTTAFSDLIHQIPDTLIGSEAKRDLDPLAPSDVTAQATGNIFPWESGTAMWYGSLGIHDNGFDSVTGAHWRAVDMASDGNTAAGHAPNHLLAAGAGSIGYKCTGTVNVAVKLGNFFYTHLVNNSNLYAGASFDQGATLGSMQTGNFNDLPCGWASQQPGWFHVHWGFPDADLSVEGWTLSMSTGNWTNGPLTVTPGTGSSWISAQHDASCPQSGGALLYWNSNYDCANSSADAGYRLRTSSGWQNVDDGAFDNQASSLKVPAGWSVRLYQDINLGGGSICYSADVADFSLEGNFPSTSVPIENQVSSFNVYSNSTCAAPAAPVLTGPADGLGAPHTYDLTFQWDPVTGANEYQVEWWAGAGTPSQPCGWTASTTCHVGSVPADRTYSWHVKARNDSSESDWSNTWTFTILPKPPAAFVKAGPGNNGTNQPPNLTISWGAGSGAGRYEYCYDITNDTACAGAWVDNGTNTSASLAGLSYNASYYWQVRAINAGGTTYANAGAWWSFKTRPATPALVTPANGENALTQKPAFTWNPVAGASSYILQIAKNDTFTLLLVNVAISSSSYTPAVSLAPGVSLYWRAMARSANGTSPWSEVRIFHSANPPSRPTLLSPASNSLTKDYTPRLDWKAVTVPAGTTFGRYELNVDDSLDFSSPVASALVTDLASHEYTLPDSAALNPNTTYYWRARACNSDDECSIWSATFKLRTTMLPPDLLQPGEASAPLSLRPLFDWNEPAGATSYAIQFAKDPGFTQLIKTVNVTPSTYIPTFDLPKSISVYWHVLARGVNGPSAWSAPRTLLTPNPPGIPALLSPASYALTTDYTPRLDWAAAAVPAGTSFDHYDIQVATEAAFTSPVILDVPGLTDVSVHEFTPATDLTPNTKYYWRVRSFNTGGQYSSWSAVRSFRTAILPPVLVTPPNGVVVTSLRPPLDWGDVSGASSFLVQVAKNPGFTLLVINARTTGSAYTPAINLPAGIPLYWRVRAYGINGPSQWSPTWSFTVAP
jgi:hypothetical protein